MNIGLRILDMRKAMDLTQAELARKAGVSQPTISKYETDPTTEHKAAILFKIAAALETSPEYLRTGSGPKSIKDLQSDQRALLAAINKLSEDKIAVLLSVAKSML